MKADGAVLDIMQDGDACHDASTAPGSSGSAVLNKAGEVIGLHYLGFAGKSVNIAASAEFVQSTCESVVKRLDAAGAGADDAGAGAEGKIEDEERDENKEEEEEEEEEKEEEKEEKEEEKEKAARKKPAKKGRVKRIASEDSEVEEKGNKGKPKRAARNSKPPSVLYTQVLERLQGLSSDMKRLVLTACGIPVKEAKVEDVVGPLQSSAIKNRKRSWLASGEDMRLFQERIEGLLGQDMLMVYIGDYHDALKK